MTGAPDPLYVAARCTLLDALEAVRQHLDAVVLGGDHSIAVFDEFDQVAPVATQFVDQATLAGGLGTFGFDDEGVPAQRVPIIVDGMFENFLTSRETAAVVGQTSNATSRADGWSHLPLIRMTNVSIEPREGTLAGEPLPEGLQESQRLEPPIFSPATKAQEGHDENISFGQVVELLGDELAGRLRDLSQQIYAYGRDVAGERGIACLPDRIEEFRSGISLALAPSLASAENLHEIESDVQGFAIYRSGKPNGSDMAEYCELGITEMMVLSGNAGA